MMDVLYHLLNEDIIYLEPYVFLLIYILMNLLVIKHKFLLHHDDIQNIQKSKDMV